MFTDTHCHVTKEFYEDINKVLTDADENLVNRVFLGGCNQANNQEILKLIKEYDNCYGTLGLHPEVFYESGNDNDKTSKREEIETSLKFIENNLINEKVIGIGEIGLDYHYTKEYVEEQKELFIKQLKLAERYNMPVVIHSRDATEDTIEILKSFKVKGIIHSFSGSYETANEYIKLGFLLGINGVITFENSKLSDVINRISLEYIVLETDCPYLTPHPFRGEKNEPKYILNIAEYIANLKKIPLTELAKITKENISRIFDI